ncbi:MAG TPA: NAD(P)/FAD-dependent oxidoreductase [Thiobacillus sp.]
MKQNFTRRDFLSLAAAGTAASLVGFGKAFAQPAQDKRVLVIGGGFAGATCAKYLRRADPTIQVTLIERQRTYVTPPSSNLVATGLRPLSAITLDYDKLSRNHGIQMAYGNAASIDPAGKTVALENGKIIPYDRLVVAPGIDFKYAALDGYSEQAATVMPHAWKAGPQTELLHRQLQQMPNGGTVIISVPPAPFRCPPGPYERASLIAYYLKRNKPKSKVLILDANDSFPAQDGFMEAWQTLYPNMIEWIPGPKGGKVVKVDAQTLTVSTGAGRHRGSVVNVIPPQKAGDIASKAGLTDETGWCPVDPGSFESTRQKGIHIIGDSSIAGKLPKSAAAANSEAKVCAAAIASLLAGRSVGDPSFVNACYALASPTYGLSIAGVYDRTADGIVPLPGALGVSPLKKPAAYRAKEAQDANGWYQNIVADSFT